MFFDLFGTIYDPAPLDDELVAQYGRLVRAEAWAPWPFPLAGPWTSLVAWPDVAAGLAALRAEGIFTATLSNAPRELQIELARRNALCFGQYLGLEGIKTYKPRRGAYEWAAAAVGCRPAECLMVTANPGFGDVEGARAVGMPAAVIRQPDGPADLVELAELLRGGGVD